MKKIAIIPIDNRPICHTLPMQICEMDSKIELFIPPREMLGALTTSSDIEGILNWLRETLALGVDYLILSLDTVAYGGLVNSRRCPEGFDEILKRVKKLEKIIRTHAPKTYAFSSIMRISNNNINEEEKSYWAQFGKRIFEYSFQTHKARSEKTASCVVGGGSIPAEILDDYLKTRERNFKINKYYLELAQRGLFDKLIFSKDDCAQFGLNIEEAQTLAAMGGQVKTGADEIPLTLLARAVVEGSDVSVNPIFLQKGGEKNISKYEDLPLDECVLGQLELAGVEKASTDAADLNFIINNFANTQGDLVLGEENVSFEPSFGGEFERTKPYFIADVNNANGADFGFVEGLLRGLDTNFYGYAGYNTSANTIGCALCIAVVKFLAVQQGTYSDDAFKKLMLVRFLDDWAYQAKIRKEVRETGEKQGTYDITPFTAEFKPFEEKICSALGLKGQKISYSLPWGRSFEVEIQL